MDKVALRPMEPADLRLVWQLVQDHKPEFAPPGWPVSNVELQRLAFLHPRACREGSILAEVGGEARGALVFHDYREEGTAVLTLICFDRGAGGRDLERRLLGRAEEEARALGLQRLLVPETPEEDQDFITAAWRFGLEERGRIVSWVRRGGATEAPEDDHIVPIVNVPLSEITEVFNECFPAHPRTSDDLYALLTQSQWGPWASVAYVEEGRVVAFLFTTDREGKPYMQHVGTRPEARRRGLALTLLKHALHVLQEGGAAVVECEVREDNVAAAKLAASFGMQPGRKRLALVKEFAEG
ncbi:MAG: GNAT family N-acetyltransferase [Candidatus Coatesbacteria bacterium]|nr:MAG: GNAT family N-acetyltransferase [Candidatus Coatesbacteria bacterium]